MKTNTSKLNPNAVSYVPFAKREVHEVDKECKTTSREASVEGLKLNGHQVDNAHGTRANIPQEPDSTFIDEEFEMDLAYLQMMFPGVADQFLADVYNLNMGDLEAAIDMLSELESTDTQQDDSNANNTAAKVSSGESSSVKTDKSSTSSSSSKVPDSTS